MAPRTPAAPHRLRAPVPGTPLTVSDLRLEYDSTSATPARARRDVRAWAAGLAEDARMDLVIAVNELVTNSVRHGPPAGRVRLAITYLKASLLFVEVSDDGAPEAVIARAPDDSGGRGLHMVGFLAADWGASARPTRTWFTLDTAARAGRAVRADAGGSA